MLGQVAIWPIIKNQIATQQLSDDFRAFVATLELCEQQKFLQAQDYFRKFAYTNRGRMGGSPDREEDGWGVMPDLMTIISYTKKTA